MLETDSARAGQIFTVGVEAQLSQMHCPTDYSAASICPYTNFLTHLGMIHYHDEARFRVPTSQFPHHCHDPYTTEMSEWNCSVGIWKSLTLFKIAPSNIFDTLQDTR